MKCQWRVHAAITRGVRFMPKTRLGKSKTPNQLAASTHLYPPTNLKSGTLEQRPTGQMSGLMAGHRLEPIWKAHLYYSVNIGGLLVLEPLHYYTRILPEVSSAVDKWTLSTHIAYGCGLEQLETRYSAFIARMSRMRVNLYIIPESQNESWDSPMRLNSPVWSRLGLQHRWIPTGSRTTGVTFGVADLQSDGVDEAYQTGGPGAGTTIASSIPIL
ncbi:hypothetical protein BDR03DRAFT_982704 [Suillus americanus]|nr:hypothetical protein BDR03DRAFT_982704 [Suillus americanus]